MFERFHPTFFYESALNLIGAALLLILALRWKRGRLWGDILLLYGMYYALIRFFIEFLRPDAWKVGGIAVAQLVSIGWFVFFGALFVIRHVLSRPAMIYTPGEPWVQPTTRAPGDGPATAVVGEAEAEARDEGDARRPETQVAGELSEESDDSMGGEGDDASGEEQGPTGDGVARTTTP
jgi:hypothetical protein